MHNVLLTSFASVKVQLGVYSGLSGSSSGEVQELYLSVTIRYYLRISHKFSYCKYYRFRICSRRNYYNPISILLGAGRWWCRFSNNFRSGDIDFTNAFTLETLGEGTIMNSAGAEGTNGSLTNGSTDNVRWEIVNPNSSSGVFSVIIRRGNDTNKSKVVLETFTNVSLDPKAPNYVARVIGDQTQTLVGAGTSDPYLQTTGSYPNGSRFVRVSSVNLKTPDYLDNNGVAKMNLHLQSH
jgi:hypothetical protein